MDNLWMLVGRVAGGDLHEATVNPKPETIRKSCISLCFKYPSMLRQDTEPSVCETRSDTPTRVCMQIPRCFKGGLYSKP